MIPFVPSIGADPEAFVFDTKKEEVISAVGLIPGTKDKPHPVKNGAIQVDGIAVEFNIDPAQTAEEFVHNTESVKKQLLEYVQETSKNLNVVFADTAIFEPKYFKKIPKEALVVGCDPAFITTGINHFRPLTVPDFPEYTRYAGGHLHVGNIFHDKESDQSKQMKQSFFVQYLRNYGQLINNNSFKTQTTNNIIKSKNTSSIKYPRVRTSTNYGATGAFRPKSYGLEYRTPNNYWVQNTGLQERIFNELFLFTVRLQEIFDFEKVANQLQTKEFYTVTLQKDLQKLAWYGL
jgi:hypothetical protein